MATATTVEVCVSPASPSNYSLWRGKAFGGNGAGAPSRALTSRSHCRQTRQSLEEAKDIKQVASAPAYKNTPKNISPEGAEGRRVRTGAFSGEIQPETGGFRPKIYHDSCLGEISFSSVFSWVSSSVRLFRSLIRLITLSKTAQSTKKATTPMAQITINVSVWLSIFMIL